MVINGVYISYKTLLLSSFLFRKRSQWKLKRSIYIINKTKANENKFFQYFLKISIFMMENSEYQYTKQS